MTALAGSLRDKPHLTVGAFDLASELLVGWRSCRAAVAVTPFVDDWTVDVEIIEWLEDDVATVDLIRGQTVLL